MERYLSAWSVPIFVHPDCHDLRLLYIPTSNMLDHFGLFFKFYDTALAPLGYERNDFIPDALVGHVTDGINFDFWIHKKDEQPRTPVHFAFRAQSLDQVDRFHAKGL
jgi:hypothetical protein